MGSSIREIPFTGLDFESAGESPNEAGVPVQIGIAQMDGLELRADLFYRSYLRVDRPVTWAAQQLHGITNNELRYAPEFRSLWPEVKLRLGGRWIVAHGCGTEKRFLRAFPHHGFGPWIDTLTLSRKMLPGRKSYALSELANEFSLVEEAQPLLPDFRWHEALSDALASLLLLRKLIGLAKLHNCPGELLQV